MNYMNEDSQCAVEKQPNHSEARRISDTLEFAAALSDKAVKLAEIICGPRPENQPDSGGTPQPSGIMPHMADRAEGVSREMRLAMDELDRIYNAFN